MIRRGGPHFALGTSVILVACGGTANFTFPDAGSAGTAGTAIDAAAPVTVPPGVSDAGTAPSNDDAAVASSPPLADSGAVIAPTEAGSSLDAASPDAGNLLGGLLALTQSCAPASQGTYATDRSASAAVSICKLNGAFFWTADLAVDCDGQTTTECNATTDATYSNQTSFTQSNGKPLIASELPYVVIPLPSSRFDYTMSNIQPGALAIVIAGGILRYGVFGDEGPTGVIGEASYAMAKSLGMSPDPNSGGTSGAVTYFVFTGKSAVVSPIEDNAAAATLGGTLAQQLIADN